MNNSTHVTPLVSVILASYNEPPDMISRAIDSILNQSLKNIELLIFDDSTKQDTINAVNSFMSDERVRIFRSEVRTGFVKSLNLGLENARGKYIARMDGDDVSLPDRLKKEYDFLESHENIFVVGGSMNIIDEKESIISSKKYPHNRISLFFYSIYRNPLSHPTVMMRRELVNLGFRYDESLELSEDLDLWLRIKNAGYKIANMPEILLNYRVLDNFEDKRGSDMQRKGTYAVRKKNSSFKRPLFSILSVGSGWLFANLPVELIKSLYRKENYKAQGDIVEKNSEVTNDSHSYSVPR